MSPLERPRRHIVGVRERAMRERVSRRWLLGAMTPAALAGVLVSACGGREPEPAGALPEADGPPTTPPPGSPLVAAGAAPVARSEVTLQVAQDDVRNFLQETLREHQTYFDTVRVEQGAAAAQSEVAAVSAPYEQRIAEMQAAGQRVITLTVPIVTLWGALSFSATAYEGPLIVKDPVSLAFYWQGDAARVYQHSIDLLTCRPYRDGGPCRTAVRFQDEDDRQGIPGHPFRCHTSPQWVLMGNAGGPLQWVRDVSGLMKTTDRCNRVGRDHIRIFGAFTHPTFGVWSVATPHRERFSFDPLPGRGGHIITSWNEAQHLYAGAWIESGLPGDRRGWDESVFYWSRFDWGNGGEYQKVAYDGLGILLGIQSDADRD
jgi:hypothetical protein